VLNCDVEWPPSCSDADGVVGTGSVGEPGVRRILGL